MTIKWNGVRRDGVAVTGSRETMHNPTGWVRHKFRRGWRSLTITRNGEQIGGIGPHADTGRRTWWSEKTKRGA